MEGQRAQVKACNSSSPFTCKQCRVHNGTECACFAMSVDCKELQCCPSTHAVHDAVHDVFRTRQCVKIAMHLANLAACAMTQILDKEAARQLQRTSWDVRGAGQAAERQVGADKDGSWREDRVAAVADRVQRCPQLQQQQRPRGGPETALPVLQQQRARTETLSRSCENSTRQCLLLGQTILR